MKQCFQLLLANHLLLNKLTNDNFEASVMMSIVHLIFYFPSCIMATGRAEGFPLILGREAAWLQDLESLVRNLVRPLLAVWCSGLGHLAIFHCSSTSIALVL